MLVKHIKKDDKEFQSQIKDDVNVKNEVLKSKPKICPYCKTEYLHDLPHCTGCY